MQGGVNPIGFINLPRFGAHIAHKNNSSVIRTEQKPAHVTLKLLAENK